MSAVDPTKLVSVSNQVAATLVREPTLDVSEALGALVETGRTLHNALDQVVEDEKFWDHLRTAQPPESWPALEQWNPGIGAFLGAQQVAILELLGYQPPPPAEELVDDTIQAIEMLADRPSVPDLRAEVVDQARAAIRTFNGRLEQLLQDRGLEPPPRRRRRLRRALVTGAKVLLNLAPVAVGYAAVGATVMIAPHLAIGAHGVIKDAATALAVPVAGAIINLLPDTGFQSVEVGAMLGQLDARTKARALASVVLNHLLHLTIEKGGGISPSAKANLDGTIDLAIPAARRVAIPGFEEELAQFETTFFGFSSRPTEARLQEAIVAWRSVQDTFDSPEAEEDLSTMLESSTTARKRWEASEATRNKAVGAAQAAKTAQDQHLATQKRQERLKVAAARKPRFKPGPTKDGTDGGTEPGGRQAGGPGPRRRSA